jgi:hypothetical protein
MTRRYRYDPETDEVVEVTAPKRGKAADTAASRFSTGLHCEALGVDPRDVKWQRMEDEQVGLKNVEYDCVTMEHEALTPQGWKSGREVRQGQLILAYDHQTETSRWEPVENVTVCEYEGKLLEITRFGTVALRCSPNHRFPVFKRFNEKRERRRVTDGTGAVVEKLYRASRHAKHGFVSATELMIRHSVPIAAPCEFGHESILSPREAAILGWAVTDGHGLLDAPAGSYARISQSPTANPQHCTAIAELLQTKQSGPHSSGAASWGIKASLARRLRSVISSAHDLPWLVTRLSHDAAKAMFDAMMDGDGHRNADGTMMFSQWHSKRKPIAEACQILAVLLGMPTSFRENTFAAGTRYNTGIMTSRRIIPLKSSSWVDFSGQIWCPKVKSGAWVCRCNGLVTMTGNSHGAPVFYSRIAYNEYKRAHGYYDRQAGYGDVSPRNR